MNTNPYGGSHGRDERALQLQARLAGQFAAILSESARCLPHDITERLRFGREQALAKAREVRLAAQVVATPVWMNSVGSLVLGGPTPGWQRAQTRNDGGGNNSGFNQGPQTSYRSGANGSGPTRKPLMIDGEVLAKSMGGAGRFTDGARVFHMKFGAGTVVAVDGNKLTVEFDRAGRKMVLESYLEEGN